MTDEKYSYIQDVKDKKSTARSARNKRTHNGKGGRVKFPSDCMTQKEIKAMSGEVKSYKLNEPMSWSEFKAMPDDIKVTYIKLLREKFNVTDMVISEMFGVTRCSVSLEMKRLGLNTGHRDRCEWDKEGFYAWKNGVSAQKEEPVAESVENETQAEESPKKEQKVRTCITSGTLSFVGSADATLDAIKSLLGKADLKITISWEAV